MRRSGPSAVSRQAEARQAYQSDIETRTNVTWLKDATHVCFQIQPKGSLPLRHLLKRNTDNLYAELKYNELGIVQFH